MIGSGAIGFTISGVTRPRGKPEKHVRAHQRFGQRARLGVAAKRALYAFMPSVRPS